MFPMKKEYPARHSRTDSLPYEFLVLFVLVISVCLPQSAEAQRYRGQRFKAGLLLGGNIAQIDGDRYLGYRKFGIQAGVQGIAVLSERFFISTEMLFSQRGSRPDSDERTNFGSNYLDFRLNYIEAPFMINLLSNKKGDDKFYKLGIFVGVSYARLVGSNITVTKRFSVTQPEDIDAIFTLPERQDEFKSNSIGIIFGATRYVKENIGITLRHTYSPSIVFEPLPTDDRTLKTLKSFFLTLGVNYIIE